MKRTKKKVSKRVAKPLNPSHVKLIKQLAAHFAKDERAPCKAPRKKRAKAKTARKVATRRVNPAPLLYIITAKGTGKKMHYDGEKFSERARVVTFKTPDAAAAKARELIAKFPVLNKYRIAVEHNQHLPARAGRSPPKT